MTTCELDPLTPVLVGVGQSSERIEDPGYEGMSPVDLAARAARAALADTGADPATLAAALDVVAAVRQFEISTPLTAVPNGRSTNVPRSIAHRIGADPARAVLDVTGGQSPQKLVTEMAREIAAGRATAALVVGGEAMSTARHLSGAAQPDWSEDPDGELEDRGYGLRGLVSARGLAHGLHDVVSQYALFENARRAARVDGRDDYAAAMGALFAPFTDVAAANPHAAAPEAVDAETLVRVDERNRMIATPYPRLVVSRDLVNQGAAVVLTSVGQARRLGIEQHRWVFLHGHADLVEQDIFDRPDLHLAPSQPAAVRAALAMADVALRDVRWLDLYSCFPVAVSQLIDALGVRPDDPRGLTLTGGLPFFGGAGNDYSLHAIAEVVDRARREPGSVGMITANGGTLSKISVGVYATTAVPWREGPDARLQAELDARPRVPLVDRPEDGWATIESWTVRHGRSRRTAVVVARTADGRRFVATGFPGDDELTDRLEAEDDPVGSRVFVRSTGPANRVALTARRMDELVPRRRVGWRAAYEHLDVRRTAGVVEITARALAHEELGDVFDAYAADDALAVAIVTFAGSDEVGPVPPSGFAGLTSRRLTKPVVAVVAGDVAGATFEAVLACTLVVADEGASFALDQARAGGLAQAGGLVRLPRAVGARLAAELAITGRRLPAAEASDLGLLNRVAPAGQALATARDLAAEVAATPAYAVRLALQVMAETDAVADELDAVRAPSAAHDEVLLGGLG